MRRREMVRLMFLAGAAASVGATSEAGQSAPPIRVGVLLPVPGNDPFLALLRDGLQGVGWTDDGAFVLEVGFDGGGDFGDGIHGITYSVGWRAPP